MLTSSAQRGEAQRMLKAGYDAYLTKPLLRASRLLDAIADSRVKRLAGVADTLLASPVPTIAPAATAGAPGAQAGKAPEGSADARPDEAVLVVEDNSVNRMLAIRVLRKLGYRAEIACDGAEAVAIVQRQRFALILMDCHMPNMDGFEATDAIRRLEQGGGRRTPIVALTAGAMHEERERCLKAGMDAFLSKPFVPTELVAMLERWSVPRTEPSRAAG
jgi:CheY-like chemotaxis protein